MSKEKTNEKEIKDFAIESIKSALGKKVLVKESDEPVTEKQKKEIKEGHDKYIYSSNTVFRLYEVTTKDSKKYFAESNDVWFSLIVIR